jgi:SulP family sulfate permease
MADLTNHREEIVWLGWFPPARWLAEYRLAWLPGDIAAGITLAAYAIPVSLAYAGLAGLPPQVGIYGYLLGGVGYALFGSSRQLAIGPTSAISLMIAGTVGAMAEGDVQRYAQIACLAAFTVAALSLFITVDPRRRRCFGTHRLGQDAIPNPRHGSIPFPVSPTNPASSGSQSAKRICRG